MRLMYRRLLPVGIVLLGAVASAPRACADEYWPYVQLTCAPELNHFMVRTFGVYNPQVSAGGHKYGIYNLSDLKDRPLTCDIGAVWLAFRLTRYKEGTGAGYCGEVEDGSAIVTVNGETVVSMSYTHGGCSNFVSHTAEVFVNFTRYGTTYTMRHCRTVKEVTPMQHDRDEHVPGSRCTLKEDQAVAAQPTSPP